MKIDSIEINNTIVYFKQYYYLFFINFGNISFKFTFFEIGVFAFSLVKYETEPLYANEK